MQTLNTILLIGACLCFLLATAGVTSRIALLPLGLLLWCLTQLVGRFG